jgi:hypothetical protein
MLASPRAALTSCLILTALVGCNRDEPATHIPKSGTWVYDTQTVASDTCDENTLPDLQGMFFLDHDQGDSFEIELGEDDVTCEIDGTEFYCTNWVIDVPVEGLDAVLRTSITWEGDFLSPSRAEGDEITRRTCIGEACPMVAMVVKVPCTRMIRFEASAV